MRPKVSIDTIGIDPSIHRRLCPSMPRVSTWSEGDHEGRIHEVPQEDRSPSMYIVNMRISSVARYTIVTYVLTMTNVVIHIITGVYFFIG
jgi:hypothetical protein